MTNMQMHQDLKSNWEWMAWKNSFCMLYIEQSLFSLWYACLFVVWSLGSCWSASLSLVLQVRWTKTSYHFFQYICPYLTHFCPLSYPVSESWSRSKGRSSLVGQQSTPSSVPLFPSAPLLSRQQQHPLGFGQVSSVLLLSLYNIWGIMQELNTSDLLVNINGMACALQQSSRIFFFLSEPQT